MAKHRGVCFLLFLMSSLAVYGESDSACRRALEIQFSHSETVPDVDFQGIQILHGKAYLIAETRSTNKGRIFEYDIRENGIVPTGRFVQLDRNRETEIQHPTGLTYHPKFGYVISNTVRRKGSIYFVDWDRMWADGNLDHAILHRVEDDAAVRGSRLEFVEVNGDPLLATSDYIEQGAEIRLYDPSVLRRVQKTSEPGVVRKRFLAGAFVQSLHWMKEQNLLVLIQNREPGRHWKLGFLDLYRSSELSDAILAHEINLDRSDELEGFASVSTEFGVAVATNQEIQKNIQYLKMKWAH